MVIRLFDDRVTVPVPPVLDDGVLCPTCDGEGEIALVNTARQDMFGVWECEHETCCVCDGAGVVSPEIATEVDCCHDNEGRPMTRLRGDRCSPEHERLCDEHLRCNDGCGTTLVLDDDPWDADLYYEGRTA